MTQTIEPHELAAAASRLPTATRVITALHEALTSPDCDHERVCQLIQTDVSITSRLLRMANSVQEQRGYQVVGLAAAVEWLGLSQTYRVVCATLSGRVCEQDLPAYAISGTALWRNSVASAVAMELLARKFGLDPQTAYTLGLFRNLGRILLQRIATQRGLLNISLTGRTPRETRELELRVFGCDHADAAAEIFKRWKLPPLIGESIRNQYFPNKASDPETTRWASMLHLAILITESSDYNIHSPMIFDFCEEAVREGCGQKSIDFLTFVSATNSGCQALCGLAGDTETTSQEEGLKTTTR